MGARNLPRFLHGSDLAGNLITSSLDVHLSSSICHIHHTVFGPITIILKTFNMFKPSQLTGSNLTWFHGTTHPGHHA